MYGCGTEGLTLKNVSDMRVVNSQIYECTYYIRTVTGGRDIAFENCVFRDNREYTLVNVYRASEVSFTNCEFEGNDGDMFSIVDATVSVSDCVFRGNSDTGIYNSPNVRFTNCTFD
jgi:hypothetical protein